MHAQPSIVALVSALALTSCASTRDVAPLLAGEHQDARMSLETGSTDLKPPAWGGVDDAQLPTVTVQTRFLSLEPKLAERILGDRAIGLVSLLSTRDQTDSALGELFAEGEIPEEAEIQKTMLTLREGQTGSVVAVHQEAYIESYELVVSAGAALADPCVGVLHEGFMFLVRAQTDEESGKTALDLELTMTEYEHPLEVREIQLVGAAAPVQIQVPEGLVRRLTTSANLGPDDVLVIGGTSLPVEGGKVLVAFVGIELVE